MKIEVIVKQEQVELWNFMKAFIFSKPFIFAYYLKDELNDNYFFI